MELMARMEFVAE